MKTARQYAQEMMSENAPTFKDMGEAQKAIEDRLTKLIEKVMREERNETIQKVHWLLDERKLLYDSRSKSNIHSFIRQCKMLVNNLKVGD